MTLMNPPESDDNVIAVAPDQTIRELIGKDVKLTDIFTKERIEACQKTIDDARTVFFDVADVELTKLEELLKDRPVAPEDSVFESIATCAANIKGHAELFGYTLVAAIASYIADACEPGPRAPDVRFRLIADLVKLLHIAVREKISDERGALGRELRASLQAR